MTHNDEPMERCPICAGATNWTPEEYAGHIAHGGDRPPVLLTDEEMNMLYPVDLATGQMIEVYTTWYRCPVGCGGPQELQDPGITQRGWRCMDDFAVCPDCGVALIWPDAENA